MRRLIPKKAQLDKLCSEIVRAKGKCENELCKGKGQSRLTWAHIIPRNYYQIRWRIDNAFCLCWSCHYYFTNHPIEWEEFVIKMIGEKKYRRLKREAIDNQGKYIDYGEIKYYLEQEKKRLGI